MWVVREKTVVIDGRGGEVAVDLIGGEIRELLQGTGGGVGSVEGGYGGIGLQVQGRRRILVIGCKVLKADGAGEIVAWVGLIGGLRRSGVLKCRVENGLRLGLRVGHKHLLTLLLALGYQLFPCFSPDPLTGRCWAGHQAIGVFPRLCLFRRWSTAVALVLLVFLSRIVDVALDEVDVGPLSLQGIHDFSGGTSGFGPLFQMVHLLLCHFAEGGMCG